MLRSDAQAGNFKVDNIIDNIASINVQVVAQIEKELDYYDLVSLVFLLYDVPDTALQRLVILQRMSADGGDASLNLLTDWAQNVRTRTTWRYEFLEALAICQLYSIIRKLGFNVQNVKKHYLPNNPHVNLYINPLKKALYKLCESFTSHDLDKFQNTLKTYDIDTAEHKSCEFVLLELMCRKLITVDGCKNKQSNEKCNVTKLLEILKNFPALQKCADVLEEIQSRLNSEPKPNQLLTTNTNASKDVTKNDSDPEYEDAKVTPDEFTELLKQLGELNFEETIKDLRTDTKKLDESNYPIKNPKAVGVCYIINQEDFYPSKESIENNTGPFEKRDGSNTDRKVLENTMKSMNFEVIAHKNLDRNKMLECIKNIITYRVQPDHSMFMLCILSHGVKGHVYAADSLRVKIDEIQNLLDDGFQKRQMDIPKLTIIQACQSKDDDPKLMADSSHYLRRLNSLIFWATAPELQAFRHPTLGSIFIRVLCSTIETYAKHDHLYDIFTKVTDLIAKISKIRKIDQVPIFESTLRKKLYLQVPH